MILLSDAQVVGIPKLSAEDTSVMVTSVTGERAQLPLPKGTRIVINTPALHRNRAPLICCELLEAPLIYRRQRVIGLTRFRSSQSASLTRTGRATPLHLLAPDHVHVSDGRLIAYPPGL